MNKSQSILNMFHRLAEHIKSVNIKRFSLKLKSQSVRKKIFHIFKEGLKT